MELGNCGELLQEPFLHFVVAARLSQSFLCLLAQTTQHLILSHDGLFFVIVSFDVGLHVGIGQALVDFLLAGCLAGNGHNLEVRVVVAGFLKLLVLVGAELSGSLSELLGHLDGVGTGIDFHSFTHFLVVGHDPNLIVLWGFSFPLFMSVLYQLFVKTSRI